MLQSVYVYVERFVFLQVSDVVHQSLFGRSQCLFWSLSDRFWSVTLHAWSLALHAWSLALHAWSLTGRLWSLTGRLSTWFSAFRLRLFHVLVAVHGRWQRPLWSVAVGSWSLAETFMVADLPRMDKPWRLPLNIASLSPTFYPSLLSTFIAPAICLSLFPHVLVAVD